MNHKSRSDSEWMEIIRKSRASGMTDKAWCELNGISMNTFYASVGRLKKRGYEMPVSEYSGYSQVISHEIVPVGIIDQNGELTPVDRMGIPTDVAPAVPAPHTSDSSDKASSDLVITLNIQGNDVWIPVGTDEATISCVIRSMRLPC